MKTEERMSKEKLEHKINVWKSKVLYAYDSSMPDTLKMMQDIDKIIADAFNHDRCMKE